MGTYYQDLYDRLVEEGIPYDKACWVHLFETQEEFESAYTGNYKEPWLSLVEENGLVAYNSGRTTPPTPVIVTVTSVTINDLEWVEDIPLIGGMANKDNCSYTVTAYYSNGTSKDVTLEAVVTGETYVEMSYIETRHSEGTLTLTAQYEGASGSRTVDIYQEEYSREKQPLTFEILTPGKITWDVTSPDSCVDKLIKYKINGGPWIEIHSKIEDPESESYYGAEFRVSAGDRVFFVGDNTSYGEAAACAINASEFGSTAKFNAEGNIMSLIDSDGYSALTEFDSSCRDGIFVALFSTRATIISAGNLFLPVTNINVPKCYRAMFSGCENLIKAPELPATGLSVGCYYEMFHGCKNLTEAPELPATMLVDACYQDMFYGCQSLNCIKCLATNISATYCTENWVTGVSPAGTFAKSPGMTGWTIGESGTPSGWTVQDAQDFTPLTFNITTGGKICWRYEDSSFKTTIEYSTDNGSTWTSLTPTAVAGADINVSAGDKVMFRGNNPTYSRGRNKCNTFSGTSATFTLEGNIMSLLSTTDFATAKAFTSNNVFYGLFKGCRVTSVEKLLLPATGLTNSCYCEMFYKCILLSTPPKLPATKLVNNCYSYMFYECRLDSAPVLPATILAPACYQTMFYECNFETAPSLPAIRLQKGCYDSMFYYCRELEVAPELPAFILAEDCYKSMFAYCFNLEKAPSVLPAATLAKGCYQYMFEECETIETAPTLSAPVLTEDCYQYMFSGCRSLVHLECFAIDKSAHNCTEKWVEDVGWDGTFDKHPDMTGWTVGDNGIPVHDWTMRNSPLLTPLTFNITSSGTICWKSSTTPHKTTISYSKDNGETWTSITSDTGSSAPSFSVSAGDKVMFKGSEGICSDAYNDYNTFATSTAGFTIEGNVMSLLDGARFETITFVGAYEFTRLFAYCNGLTSAENLALPAKILSRNCYSGMFTSCRNLTKTPELPAETLANYCYQEMFSGCTSLTTAPELPATTLAPFCYSSMFYSCTTLTTAPELPATTLARDCYKYMFCRCTSLITAPELPATTLAENCYYGMFEGCKNLLTPPDLWAENLAKWCYYGMFKSCTKLTIAPQLIATNLTTGCYENMFDNCTSLNYINCFAVDITADYCTANWVRNVASTGTFRKNPNMSSWPSGVDGIPTGWTVEDSI